MILRIDNLFFSFHYEYHGVINIFTMNNWYENCLKTTVPKFGMPLYLKAFINFFLGQCVSLKYYII